MNRDQTIANLETEINCLAWHIQVVKESKVNMCPMVTETHQKMIKYYFDKLFSE